MGVHSILIVSNKSMNIVYSRYFGLKSKESSSAFESKMAQHTRPYWPELTQSEKKEMKWCTVCLESSVVLSFCMIGELVLYVNGTEDYDEATLVEPGEVISELLLKLLDKKDLVKLEKQTS